MYCGLMRVLFSMGTWVLRLTNYFSACVFDTWWFWYMMFLGGGIFHMQTMTEHRRWVSNSRERVLGACSRQEGLVPRRPGPFSTSDWCEQPPLPQACLSLCNRHRSQSTRDWSLGNYRCQNRAFSSLFLAAILLQRKRTNTATFCAWCFRWVCFSLFTQEETGSNYVSHLPRSELATRQNRHSN